VRLRELDELHHDVVDAIELDCCLSLELHGVRVIRGALT